MNTRKASLRKLRLPGAIDSKARKGRQKSAETISSYFANEEHSEGVAAIVKEAVCTSTTPSPITAIDNEKSAVAEKMSSGSTVDHGKLINFVETTLYSGQMPSPIEINDQAMDKPKRALRTKLSTFLPKEKRLKTEKIKTHDFDTPKKVIKRAPKTKPKKTSKKQQNIKTAFLKHEELFTEVTAQHCLVDNVNPDEMQMAIALSRSEAEISMTMEEAQQSEEKENEQKEGKRDKLKRFGFRVAESEDYNITAFMPTKSKTKWANKFTALTLRNPQRQLAKVNKRIEHLMSSQFAMVELLQNDETERYSLRSKALVKFRPQDQHIIRSSVCESTDLLEFYVLSLFEPSRTRVGHLLKDVRRIAGREASPEKGGPGLKNPQNEAFLSPVTKRSRCDKVMSSSCPFPTRDFVNVFETAVKQSETFHEHDINSNNLETQVDVMKNKTNDEKLSDKLICETTNIPLSNERSFSESIKAISRETETATSPLRCTSPDIFADSDTDVATDECLDFGKQLNTSKSSMSECHITTYEMFSSDEVKTFSVTRVDGYNSFSPTSIIDLTQCGSDSNSQPSQNDVKQEEEHKEDMMKSLLTSPTLNSHIEDGGIKYLKTVESTEPSVLGHHSLERISSNSFGSSVSEDFSKSNSMKITTSAISIDLTQNDDEEDDCILLSDDEVNYSMWQAKETGNIQLTHLNANESINCLVNGKNGCEKAEFSFVEFVASSQPTQSDEIDKGLTQNSNSSLDIEIDVNLSKRYEFDILENHSPFKTPTKTPRHSPKIIPNSKSPKSSFLSSPCNGNSPNFNKLSDFEHSGQQSPFKTPKKTPTNTPLSASPKCRRALSNSFKSSKSEHSSNGDLELDLDFSKRSDFGILDEQSPFKTPTGTPKKTPRKTPPSATPRCRKALSESFILSPGERVTPIKRFSSINKFTEFSKLKIDDEDLSDLDEIDKLIYGSPSKRAYKKPAGLDQLLNGPINTEPNTPQKSEPDSPKEFIFNGRTYLVRTTNVSQMLDYDSMDEAALLNQLYKYGIRRLKRKQAIKVLEYIYKQTHPCLVEAAESPAKHSEDENSVSEEILPNDKIPNEFKYNLKDCWGNLLVSDAAAYMEIEDEQYILQTNISKKISTALLPFHIAWHNLVKSNKQLHEAILHYEPIDLQEIYLFFKGLGFRYDPKELKYFFDSRSIIFRYDVKKGDPSAGSNRHTRKRPYRTIRSATARTKLS